MSAAPWYRDPDARSFILASYLPWLAGLNLAWETAHVSLYTLWTEAGPSSIAFSVVHCTAGDVLIGLAALLFALIVAWEKSLAEWRWPRIAAITMLAGTAYTVFSEWMNTSVLRTWTYAEAMPRLELAHIAIGLTPMAQWLVVPPVALYLARRTPR